MNVKGWLTRHLFSGVQPKTIVFYPDGVEPRGFHGKNAFADQLNLIGQGAQIIFDIGANVGQTVEKYLQLFPFATIHCFEPFPASYQSLTTKNSDIRSVRCHLCAVSESDGEKSLHTFTNSVTNSLLPASTDVYRFVQAGQMDDTGVIKVESITIDTFCRQESIRAIDILKFDIQGGELNALRGAAGMLSNQRVQLVYAELLFVPVYQGQADFHEVASYLSRHGYRLYDFYNFSYSERGQLRWGDAIFLPSR